MRIHRVSVLLLTPQPPLLVNSEQVGFEWKVQRSEFTRRGGAKSTFENPEVISPEILRRAADKRPIYRTMAQAIVRQYFSE